MAALWKLRVRAGVLKERILNRLLPSRMDVFPCSWPLLPDVCPCDVHFCDYLEEHRVSSRSIFHFGSGGHHLVGLRNHDRALDNDVLAITASPSEHERYVKLVRRDPSLARHYRVLLADIYDLDPAPLPAFDIVTLFHLCEYTPRPPRIHRLDDAGIVGLLSSKLAPRGRIFFYSGSCARDEASRIVERRVADGSLAFEAEYKSLLVYRGR